MRNKIEILSFLLGLVMAFGLWAGPVNAEQSAVVVTAAADYSSGATSVIDVNPIGGPRAVQNDLMPTISDLGVAAHGCFFYRIERYMCDNITKFDISDPSTPVWQYSTLDDDETVTSDPHAMIFASDHKAYILRYEKTAAWMVDPTATSHENFKTGELDLSAYADSDGIPEMTNGVIVDGKLFILIQRMDRNNNWVPGSGYVAVFDISTDQEIVTETGNPDGLKGILLPAKNPEDIQYVPQAKKIYISCKGSLEGWTGTPAEYSGGILSLDPYTYEVSMIVDDGDETNHPYGNIYKMVIVSKNKGYFNGFIGWEDNYLFSFNPLTGVVEGPVSDTLNGINITTMGVDENGYVWIGDATAGGMQVVNSADDTVDEFVGTNLNPHAIAFTNDELHTYYLPYLISSNEYATGLALRNMSTTTDAIVTVTGYSPTGETIYAFPQKISARGQVNFIAGRDTNLLGWLKIESTQPLGGLSFVAHGSPVPYMADMSLIGDLYTSLLIPHVAQTSDWDTRVMICNPNVNAATVTLRFVNQNGEVLFTKEYQVTANGSSDIKLDDLAEQNDLKSGSVEIISTEGVAAFALYENLKAGGYYFSGISSIEME